MSVKRGDLESAQKNIEAALEIAKLLEGTAADAVVTLLSEVYRRVYVEAHVEPDCKETELFAKRLLPLMMRLNEIIKFKK